MAGFSVYKKDLAKNEVDNLRNNFKEDSYPKHKKESDTDVFRILTFKTILRIARLLYLILFVKSTYHIDSIMIVSHKIEIVNRYVSYKKLELRIVLCRIFFRIYCVN